MGPRGMATVQEAQWQGSGRRDIGMWMYDMTYRSCGRINETNNREDEPGQRGRCYNGWVVALATPTAIKGRLARIYLEADPTENNLPASPRLRLDPVLRGPRGAYIRARAGSQRDPFQP